MRLLFKIISRADWQRLKDDGCFAGAAVDVRDGYIHLSAHNQVAGTLEKHFKGKEGLVLVGFDPDKLDSSKLKWEISRDNEKFPHYYANLPLGAVSQVHDLTLNENNTHIIPL
ncbi:DUF952 domain-containing protein [Emcibacter sp.]|uniref:DUF952 domain-containing protein n=1 Tax=Emcibacter sp. TaxID=1979954 RepID=UPI002AA67900|nr:DUF952 domain-containing protein [Emcibacter sp.]